MSLLRKIINAITRPFINFRNKIFNLVYKTDDNKYSTPNFDNSAFTKTIFENKRKKFWEDNEQISKAILNFNLDGTVEQNSYSKNKDTLPNKNIWFEAAIFKKDGDTDFSSQKQYIIMICDFDDYYEKFSDKMNRFVYPESNVICFNPPGMGRSPGETNSPADYQDALKAIIDKLHAEGIPDHHIALLGHGFGAGIALTVAADYQQQKRPIRVIADRCHSNTAKLAGMQAQEKVHSYFKNSFLRSFFGTIAYYIANGLVRLLGLNIDAADAFSTIHKINPEHVRAIEVEDDVKFPAGYNLASGVDIKMHGNIKTFTSSAIIRHDDELTALTLKGERSSYANTANNIIQGWLDDFKDRPGGPEWVKMLEARKEIYLGSETFTRGINYMYDGIQKLWNRGVAREEMDVEKQHEKTTRASRRKSGGS